jgi:hypothetical protein
MTLDAPRTERVSTRKLKRKMSKAEAASMPSHIDVPSAPTYDPSKKGERAPYEAQQVCRVELLMTKGIHSKRQLMSLLEIKDHRQIDRYIARVSARWEMTGTSKDHARHRGEGLNRLDLVESELWSKLGNIEDPRTAIATLSAVLNVHKERVVLQGLTPKVIERIGLDKASTVDFSKAQADHGKVSRIAARMVELIGEQTGKVIEHAPSRLLKKALATGIAV